MAPTAKHWAEYFRTHPNEWADDLEAFPFPHTGAPRRDPLNGETDMRGAASS